MENMDIMDRVTSTIQLLMIKLKRSKDMIRIRLVAPTLEFRGIGVKVIRNTNICHTLDIFIFQMSLKVVLHSPHHVVPSRYKYHFI